MNRQGFTLLEFVAVIALIMIIASIAIPNYTGMVDKNRLKADGVTAMEIAKISEGYYAENKAKAKSEESLKEYVKKVYGGEIPKPQYDATGSFKFSVDNTGRATVQLIATSLGGALTLVDKGKFKEPDFDNLHSTEK